MHCWSRRVHHPAFEGARVHFAGRRTQRSSPAHGVQTVRSVLDRDGQGLPTVRIESYTLISRHDRADGRQGGGVTVFALERHAHWVTLLENSKFAERSWVIFLSDKWAFRDWILVLSARSSGSRHHPQVQERGTAACCERRGLCCVGRRQCPPSEVVEVLQWEQPRRPGAERCLQGARPDAAGP